MPAVFLFPGNSPRVIAKRIRRRDQRVQDYLDATFISFR